MRFLFLPLAAFALSGVAAVAQSQLPTEPQILGNIISQQSQENARLVVELTKMQQALAKEKARADAAEAKLLKLDESTK